MQGFTESYDESCKDDEQLTIVDVERSDSFVVKIVTTMRQIGVDDHQPQFLEGLYLEPAHWVLLKLKEPTETLLSAALRLSIQYQQDKALYNPRPPKTPKIPTNKELSGHTLLESLLISLKLIETPIFYADVVIKYTFKAIGYNPLNPVPYYFLATLYQTGKFVKRKIHLAVEYYAKCMAVESSLEENNQSDLYQPRFTAACEEGILYLRNQCDFSKIECSNVQIPGYIHYLIALGKWSKHPKAIEHLINAGNAYLSKSQVDYVSAVSLFSHAYIYSASPVNFRMPMPRWWLTSVDMKTKSWEMIYANMHQRAQYKMYDLIIIIADVLNNYNGHGKMKRQNLQMAFKMIMTLAEPHGNLSPDINILFLFIMRQDPNAVVNIVIANRVQSVQLGIYIDLLKTIIAFDNEPVPVGGGLALHANLRSIVMQDLSDYYDSNDVYLLSKPDFTQSNLRDNVLLRISLMNFLERKEVKSLSAYSYIVQFIKVFTDNISDMLEKFRIFNNNCALLSRDLVNDRRGDLSDTLIPSADPKEPRQAFLFSKSQ